MTSSSMDIQDLVDCFDDIPNMMKQMHKVTKSCPATCPDVHQSSGVDSALRGYENIDVSLPANGHRVERMAQQALKVLDQLSRIPEVKKVTSTVVATNPKVNGVNRSSIMKRTVEETSSIVRDKLTMLKNNGVDLNKFYAQYDVQKNGKMSYKDFSDTLLAVSSGIRRDEAHVLAAQLDKKKTGSIEYKKILDALQEVGPTSKTANVPLNESSTTDIAAAPEPVIKPNTSFNYLNLNSKPLASQNYNDEQSDANEVIRITELSPNQHNSWRPSDKSTSDRTGRKQFHRNDSTIFSSGLNGPPSDDDISVKSDAAERQRRRRSSSAPAARRSHSLLHLADHGSNNNFPTERIISKEKEMNLRSLLDHKDAFPDGNKSETTKAVTSKTSRHCRPEVVELRKAYQASLDSPARKKSCFTREVNQDDSHKVLENMVISGLGGKVGTLRHLLKQQDKSLSGSVSCTEFKVALTKAGINMDSKQSSALFNKLCNGNNSAVTERSSLSDGKFLNIDGFINRMQMRSCANAFNHVHDSTLGDKTRTAEEIRVMKKVLDAASKSTDAHAVLDEISDGPIRSAGEVGANQLRESLQILGANLSNSEFETLILASTDQGVVSDVNRINIGSFTDTLREKVFEYQQENRNTLQQKKKSFNRYHDSYNSSQTDYLFGNNEHEPVRTTSRKFNTENKKWQKLQLALQKNPEKILAAFNNPTNYNASDDSNAIPIGQLKSRLAKAGLALADDDVGAITAKIQSTDRQQETVSLTSFCDVAGLTMRSNHDESIALCNPREFEVEGGIFAAGVRSQAANPTSSTSLFCQSNEESNKWISGEKRRRIPQPLHAHSAEPSRFWEMTHTDPMALFPQPMPSLREPLPVKHRGRHISNISVNSSMDNSLHSKPQQHSDIRSTDKRLLRSSIFVNYADNSDWIDRYTNNGSNHSYENDSSFVNRPDYDHESGGGSSSKRSRSAPPRSSIASYLTPSLGDNSGIFYDERKVSNKNSHGENVSQIRQSQPQSLGSILKPTSLSTVMAHSPSVVSQSHSLRRQFPQSRQSSYSCPFAVDATVL